MYENATVFLKFQLILVPVWAVYAVYAGFFEHHFYAQQNMQNSGIMSVVFRYIPQTTWEFLVSWQVGDVMLVNIQQQKHFDVTKHRKTKVVTVSVFALVTIYAWIWELIFVWVTHSAVVRGPVTDLSVKFFTAIAWWFYLVVLYGVVRDSWTTQRIPSNTANGAALKLLMGYTIFQCLEWFTMFLRYEQEIRKVYLQTAAALTLWDYFLLSFLCMLVFPGCSKLYSMLFLGELVRKSEKYAFCCKMPMMSYRRCMPELMHVIQVTLKYRIAIAKFLFVFNSPLVSIPSVSKDVYYSIFNFCLKVRPPVVIGVIREKRKAGKDIDVWRINDSPSVLHWTSSDQRVAQYWKVAAKYCVDWVPHWARVIFPFSLEYPFDAVRKIGAANKEGVSARNPHRNECHGIRTGYYGAGSYFMRVGSLPAFCCVDAVGMTHFRRYKRASTSAGFVKIWSEWLLQESKTSMQTRNDLGEYKIVEGMVEEVAKEETYADLHFPLGIVPQEQFVQFQYVLCLFHQRVYKQSYIRQGVKICMQLFLITLFTLWILLRHEAQIGQKSLGICAEIIAHSTSYPRFYGSRDPHSTCKCIFDYRSGMVNLMHVMKGLILLLIDVCETLAAFSNHSSSVHPSHRGLVYGLGTVSKFNHLFIFHVRLPQLANQVRFLLSTYALHKTMGEAGWKAVPGCESINFFTYH